MKTDAGGPRFQCPETTFAGAGGENRTHDLPLTKGLRYHYATPACPSAGRPIAQARHEEKSGMSARSEERRQRLAAALRANLRRRKSARPSAQAAGALAEQTAQSGLNQDGRSHSTASARRRKVDEH